MNGNTPQERIATAQSKLIDAAEYLETASHSEGVEKFRHQKLAARTLAEARSEVFNAQAVLETEILL